MQARLAAGRKADGGDRTADAAGLGAQESRISPVFLRRVYAGRLLRTDAVIQRVAAQIDIRRQRRCNPAFHQ